MAHSSWGRGWPNCEYNKWTVLDRPDGLRIPLHKDLVGLVAILIDLTEMSGLDVRPGMSWGSACRAVRGTNTASNHSWGTAVDINAPHNPMASRAWHAANGNRVLFGRRLKTEFTEEIVEMWENHGFRWGGRYNSRPDTMHFEFMGTVSEARATTARLLKWLGSDPAPAPAPPADSGGDGFHRGSTAYLQKGDKHPDVGVLQKRLGLKADNIFGSKTEAAVKAFQKSVGLKADGLWGKQTEAAWVSRNNSGASGRETEKDRIKQLQGFLKVRQDGLWGPKTEAAARRKMIGWKGFVGHGVALNGNADKAMVKWLQRQGNRKFGYGLKVDGLLGPATNHLIVVGLGQRDGICGPKGYREAVK